MARTPRVFLVNTMNNNSVISRHFTREAAEAADRKLQRATRRYNGPNCWSPTRVLCEYSYRTSKPCSIPLDVIEARDFADACQKLMLIVTPEMIEEGHWGWVEDHDGERFEVGQVPGKN